MKKIDPLPSLCVFVIAAAARSLTGSADITHHLMLVMCVDLGTHRTHKFLERLQCLQGRYTYCSIMIIMMQFSLIVHISIVCMLISDASRALLAMSFAHTVAQHEVVVECVYIYIA